MTLNKAMAKVLRADLAAEEQLFSYQPHPGQLAFHQSKAKVRGCFPGNRWGKSVAATKDYDWAATGRHPVAGAWPEPPVRLRVVADGFEVGVDEILIPLFRDEIPVTQNGQTRMLRLVDHRNLKGGSWDTGYNKGRHTITYRTGSTIQFMSYSQADLGKGGQKFAGVALDGVWFDEHGPYGVWDECQARIGSRPMRSIITLTPILGMTWEHEEIYERWQHGDTSIECFTGEMVDNPFISRREAEEYLAKIKDSTLREVRAKGIWAMLGGAVYGIWNPDIHFIRYDQQIVDRLTKTVLVDPHPSKPEAVLWAGIDRDQKMYAYRELVQRSTIREVCDEIRHLSGERQEDIRRFFIDSHWGWEPKETGVSIQQEYINNKIPVRPAYSGKEMSRIVRLRELLEISPTSGPTIYVMDSCPQLKWQIEHNQFKPQTEAMSEADRWTRRHEDDDLLDCLEYFVMSQPVYLGRSASAHHKPRPSSTASRILKHTKGGWGKVPVKGRD